MTQLFALIELKSLSESDRLLSILNARTAEGLISAWRIYSGSRVVAAGGAPVEFFGEEIPNPSAEVNSALMKLVLNYQGGGAKDAYRALHEFLLALVESGPGAGETLGAALVDSCAIDLTSFDYQNTQDHLAYWRKRFEERSLDLAVSNAKKSSLEDSLLQLKVRSLNVPPSTASKLKAFALEGGFEIEEIFFAIYALYLQQRFDSELLPINVLVDCTERRGHAQIVLKNEVCTQVSFEAKISFIKALSLARRTLSSAKLNARIPAKLLLEELGEEFGLNKENFSPFSYDYRAKGSELAFDSIGRVAFLRSSYFPAKLSLTIREAGLGQIVLLASSDDDDTSGGELSTFLERLATVLHFALEFPSEEMRVSWMYLKNEEIALKAGLYSPIQKQNILRLEALQGKFESAAAINSQRIAVKFGEETLTYGQLDQLATNLGSVLEKEGIKKGDVVGLCTPRSLEMIAGLIAILKVGGTYLPLDPAFPAERLKFMAADARAVCILRPKSKPSIFDGVISCVDLEKCWEPANSARKKSLEPLEVNQLAYIAYTSGSTGVPKGVMITHASVVSYIEFMLENYKISADDVVLNISTIGFDASLREIFGPLSVGGTLVLVPSEVAKDPGVILKRIRAEGVTKILSITPSFLRLLCDSVFEEGGGEKYSINTVLVSGEILDRDLCLMTRNAFGRQLELVNQYGPTECTMTSTWYSLKPDQEPPAKIPVGRPIRNSRVYVLNRSRELLPIGFAGEICIGGVGLARGYTNSAEGAPEKFFSSTALGAERLYATGDLGRWGEGGQLEYLGRLDFQLKIRGARVEPGEIEAVLLKFPSVRAAAVIPERGAAEDLILHAFVVLSDETSTDRLRALLVQRLPDFMLPSKITRVENIPLTPSGKADRNALSLLVPPGDAEYAAPIGEIEEKIASLFAEFLDIDKVGRNDDFFFLGGHSM
jgi:amino acid adenylation domain-containing protein